MHSLVGITAQLLSGDADDIPHKQQMPHDSIGLISSLHDSTISMFFSFGELGGALCPAPTPLPYDKLEGGLRRLSAQGVPVYMLPGGKHTHTGSKTSFYSTSVSGVMLYKWVTQLIDKTQPDPPSVQPAESEEGDGLLVEVGEQ